MKIGIIGIGSLTSELACRAVQAGYKVIVNHPRGNSLVRETIEKMSPDIELGNLHRAASAEIVILFVPKTDLETVIRDLPDMTGKIIIHTSSLIFDPHSLLPGITFALTYQITAALLPKAHVVKLFKPIKLEAHTVEPNRKKDEIFYIANHIDTKNHVSTFFKNLNFLAIDLSDKLLLHTIDSADNNNTQKDFFSV